jgi:hypothetical protein
MNSRLAIFLLLAAAAIAAKIPLDAREAHRTADAVLWPGFISASNNWAINHGGLDDPSHLSRIDAKDQERFHATCEAFEAWHKAMKQAGY